MQATGGAAEDIKRIRKLGEIFIHEVQRILCRHATTQLRANINSDDEPISTHDLCVKSIHLAFETNEEVQWQAIFPNMLTLVDMEKCVALHKADAVDLGPYMDAFSQLPLQMTLHTGDCNIPLSVALLLPKIMNMSVVPIWCLDNAVDAQMALECLSRVVTMNTICEEMPLPIVDGDVPFFYCDVVRPLLKIVSDFKQSLHAKTEAEVYRVIMHATACVATLDLATKVVYDGR